MAVFPNTYLPNSVEADDCWRLDCNLGNDGNQLDCDIMYGVLIL